MTTIGQQMFESEGSPDDFQADLAAAERGKRIEVGIFETDVLGAKAYHARCLKCGWQCKRYDREAAAVHLAKKHRCK